MSVYDEAKDAEYKVRKEAANADGEVAHGMNRLKENVMGLTKSVKNISNDKARRTNDYAHEIVSSLKASGADAIKKTEVHIREKPGQSVAIAFAAGILTSILLRRRNS